VSTTTGTSESMTLVASDGVSSSKMNVNMSMKR
jgi:hypothetical protein